MTTSDAPAENQQGEFGPTPAQRRTEWLVVIIAFAAVNLLSAAFQEPISYNDGRGADGVVYFGVAAQISVPIRPEGRAPFVYRIGTPLLAALVPGRIQLAHFEIVNIVANAIACMLLVVWLRLYVDDWRVRAALAVGFITQWHGPVRYVHFYPTSVEPWTHVFLLAGLIIIHRIRCDSIPVRIAALAVISALGVVFREIVLLVPLAFCFAANPLASHGRRNTGPISVAAYAIPLVAGAVALLGVRWLAIQVNDYTFVSQATRFVTEKSPWRYVLSFFIAFGPLAILPFYDWRGSLRLLSNHQHLLVFLVATALLAYVGGSDTERFLFWAMPVVYVLVGRSIENRRSAFDIGLVSTLIAAQCISQRFFWTIPDFPGDFASRLPLLTPLSSEVPYRDLLALAPPRVAVLALVGYAVVAALTLIWLAVRERRIAHR